MRAIHFVLGALFSIAFLGQSFAADYYFGKIPGLYLGKKGASQAKLFTGYLKVEGKLIKEVEEVSSSKMSAKMKELAEDGNVVEVKSKGKWSVFYPGLIDLHGHNKQNMLDTWRTARGRFANRFEWRKLSNEYQVVQGGQMNPWSSEKASKIAAYRWNDLQAMVHGTAYTQGKMENQVGFAAKNVEDKDAFITEKKKIESTGDVIDPIQATWMWNNIRPVIDELGCLGKDKCYGQAVAKFFKDNCKKLPEVATKDMYAPESYKWLEAAKNKKTVIDACGEVASLDFQSYFLKKGFGTNQHSTFIKKYHTIKKTDSVYIVHLAEGRRFDPYNWTEYQVLKLAGLDQNGLVIIHGVGLGKEDFEHMADKKRDIGLVWSPYSNFILYGQTVDIEKALDAKVNIALGSDWTPTGSKGVLHELKIARAYAQKVGLSSKDGKEGKLSDKVLFEMVTSNSAKMIKHYGSEGEGEHGIGTLAKDTMAAFIAVDEVSSDAYNNLVEKVTEENINFYVLDGKPMYGNASIFETSFAGVTVEPISHANFTLELEKDAKSFPPYRVQGTAPLPKKEDGEEKEDHKQRKDKAIADLQKKYKEAKVVASAASATIIFPDNSEESVKKAKELGKFKKISQDGNIIASWAHKIKLTDKTKCKFSEQKVYAPQKSEKFKDKVEPVLKASSLNLDTYTGIAKYLGVSLLSQSHNAIGNKKYEMRVKKFPPLYGCDDATYEKHVAEWVKPDGDDYLDADTSERQALRDDLDLNLTQPKAAKVDSPIFRAEQLSEIPLVEVDGEYELDLDSKEFEVLWSWLVTE